MKKILIIRSNVDYFTLFNSHPRVSKVYEEDAEEDTPDVVVFTGGPDVSPELYGEKKLQCTYPSKAIENLYDEVWDKYPNAVKVGICFGGQWLNVKNGGAMWQDVNNHALSSTHLAFNLLKIKNSILSRETFDVTSTHHQMMIAGPDSEILAIAKHPTDKNKGLSTRFISANEREVPKFDTEVVYYEKTKSLCFQPHPEFQHAIDCKIYFLSLLQHLFEV